MQLVTWVFIVFTLLCIGSAIGCLTFRFPIKLKAEWTKEAKEHLKIEDNIEASNPLITSHRSQCPHCHMTLAIQDLIPILSYFLNARKCRGCKCRISARYPIIESVFLALTLPIFFIANDEVEALLMLLFWSCLYTGAVIDFEHLFIPDESVLLGIFAAFILHFYSGNNLDTYVLGAMFGYAGIYMIRLIYTALKGVEGIGLGDAGLIAAIGAMVGLQSMYHVLILACVFGVVGHFFSKNKRVPFGPSLVAAAAVIFYSNFL